jgi:hypothetical protein
MHTEVSMKEDEVAMVTEREREDRDGKEVEVTMVTEIGKVEYPVKGVATDNVALTTMMTVATATITTTAAKMMVTGVAEPLMVVEAVGMVTSLPVERMGRRVVWKVVEQEVVVEVGVVAMVLREKSAPVELMTGLVDQAEGMFRSFSY